MPTGLAGINDDAFGGLFPGVLFGPKWNPTVRSSSEFDLAQFDQDYLIEGVLVEGQHGVIGGPEKTLKTSIAIDMAVSLGTGTPFLFHGEFAVSTKTKTLVISGESGEKKIQTTARMVCQSRGLNLSDADVAWIADGLPLLSDPGQVAELEHVIRGELAKVCIIDPAYLCIGNTNPFNVLEMGQVLGRVGDVGQRTGCTMLIVHHAVKPDRQARFRPMELADLSGAGWREWARQWFLLSRKSAYKSDGKHELLLNFGGSAGHSGRPTLLIDEGFPMCRWDVAVSTASTRMADDRQAKSEKLERLKTLMADRFQDGETKSMIRDRSSFSTAEFEELFGELIQSGFVTECQVRKGNGQTYQAYKPSEERNRGGLGDQSGERLAATRHAHSGPPLKGGGSPSVDS